MIYQNYHPWIIPFHVHPTLELHYILAGKGQIQIEDRLFSVKSNDIYVTLPFVPHQQISDADEVMEEYCISCTLSFSDAPCECPEEIDLLRRFISTQLFCSCEAPAPLLPMLKQLEWEFDHEAVYHRLQGKLLTLECVIEFLRALAGSARTGKAGVIPIIRIIWP